MNEETNNQDLKTDPTPETDIDYKTKYQYALADLQNQFKRFQKEKEDITKYAQEKIIKELLTSLDSFQEALKFITDPGTRQGILYIQNNLEKSLEKFGFSRIKITDGELFNPYFHEAIDTINNLDLPDQSISQEVLAGYRLGEKVIRASKVIVNKT